MVETENSTLLTAAVGSLVAAITYLFKLVMRLTKDQAEHVEKLGEFRGRQEGVTRLSASVLETVHRAARLPPGQLKSLLPDEPTEPEDTYVPPTSD